MNGKAEPAFVDSNVLIYAFEKVPSLRKATARRLLEQLMEEGRLNLSSQVLAELYVNLTRKVSKPSSPQEALAVLDELSLWPMFVIDYAAIRDAADLSRKALLSFWDALIVIAAAGCGAQTLYTEDLNDGQEILGVRVVNPFREAA